jgi:RNA polymerase sigma-70 factor (ECF subfamily)
LAGPPPDEEHSYLELQAYLECRCRHVEPPLALVVAWDRFYALNTLRIRAFLGTFGLPEADLEDCLQDLWSKVLTGLATHRYDPRRARLSAWLTIMARNLAVDALRRRRRVSAGWDDDAFAVADADPGPAAAYDRLSTQARVRRVLAELSARAPALSFRVFYLRAMEGRTGREVEDSLGLTPGQVRFRLHRMKSKFRDLYEQSDPSDRSEEGCGPTRDGEKNGISRNIARPRAY